MNCLLLKIWLLLIASHAAAAVVASIVQTRRLLRRYGFINERTRQIILEATSDGVVLMGTLVAPLVNGDTCADISTRNAMLQGSK